MSKEYQPNLNNWPLYFKNTLRVGNLKSNVGIVSLWTPVDFICKGIEKELYAIAGQLYSEAGVNFIVRNVLANPRIRYLILCGKEGIRENSGQALINLMEKGIDKENQIIGTRNAFLDKEIPKKAIDEFRNGVKIINLKGVIDSKKIKDTILGLSVMGEFARPFIYPNPAVQKGRFPSDRTPDKIKASTVAEAWVEVLRNIMRFGNDEMTNYGTLAREVPNLIVTVTKEDPFKPALKPFLNLTQEDISTYIKEEFFAKKIVDEKYYGYGERIFAYPPRGIDQVEIIVKKLKKDFNDRGAIIVLWNVEKDNYILRNPCLVLIQGKIIKEDFDLTAYFRSNDIFSAWPLNAFGLLALQHEIAKRINKNVGVLTTISSCAHIYQERWQEAEKIIKEYGKKLSCEWDPRGNFVISVEKDKIKTLHFSPDGKNVLGEYEGKTAQEVFEKIDANLGVSQISHAFDLGTELQKAEIALKHDLKYIQDQPLIL